MTCSDVVKKVHSLRALIAEQCSAVFQEAAMPCHAMAMSVLQLHQAHSQDATARKLVEKVCHGGLARIGQKQMKTMSIYIHTYVYTYILCIYIYIHAHIVYIYIYIYICMYVCIYIYIYIQYIHLFIFIHVLSIRTQQAQSLKLSGLVKNPWKMDENEQRLGYNDPKRNLETWVTSRF